MNSSSSEDKSRGGLCNWNHHGISYTAIHAEVQEHPCPAGAVCAAVRATHRLTLGIRSETQAASLKVLQYREGHGRHRRTGVIRVLLQPRAATVQLPQVYRAEVVVQTALPWAKSLARGMKWTLCVWVSSSVYIALIVLAVCWARPLVVSARNRRLSEIQADGKMASGLGSEDIGESSSKEVSEDFAVKWRERRSKRKAQFRTRLHGGSMDLESTEGSTSNVAVVETSEAMNDP